MNPSLPPLVIAVGLLASLFLALELGFRGGRRAASRADAPGASLVGPVQGALLGLLGLLLGFSFAGSAQRFMDRQDLIVQEANAIGTAYLRADLLDEPYRSDLKRNLASYLAFRVEYSRSFHGVIDPQAAQKVVTMQNAIWKSASDGVEFKPVLMMPLLTPVNEVLDLHTTRVAAGRKHFPLPLLGLLIVCAWLAIGVIGYGCGLSQQRVFAMTGSLAFLIGAALWITIDLDHPRNGFIQLSDVPLQELSNSLSDPE